VYRPGGSALNSGQVGSLRAALYIAKKTASHLTGREAGEAGKAFAEIEEELARSLDEILTIKTAGNGETGNVKAMISKARESMDFAGGMFRDEGRIKAAIEEIKEKLNGFFKHVCITGPCELGEVFRLKDLLSCQFVYLYAMKDYIERGGKSRGSALYRDKEGAKPHPALPDEFRATIADKGELAGMIQEIVYHNGECAAIWRAPRPIPRPDDFFENVWKEYREHGNVL